jgi:hypothetical protein
LRECVLLAIVVISGIDNRAAAADGEALLR